MVWRPARACTPRVMRSPGPSVLAVQLLGMACCKARTTGIEWHMSVSSVKDWRCKNHQFGGNRQLRKAQLEPSAGLICYLDLNQVDKLTKIGAREKGARVALANIAMIYRGGPST